MVSHWLAPSLADHHPHTSIFVDIVAVLTSIAAFAVGIRFAYKKFHQQQADEPVYHGFASFAYQKFYVDELYHYLLVIPYQFFGKVIWKNIEPWVTDGPVKLAVWLYDAAGKAFKAVQVGYVRVYAIYMVIGLSVMSLLISRTLNL